MNHKVALAHSITRQGSLQSYYSARFLADRESVDDALMAYAYFRWVDDYIDDVAASAAARKDFIERQKELIERAYASERMRVAEPQEDMILELIAKDRSMNSKLHSYINNMLAIISFDAERHGRPITQKELTWYSNSLGKAVIDNLEYFIGNGYSYPVTRDKYQSAIGAHVAHMLRDMVSDMRQGYYNVPSEYLKEHQMRPDDLSHPAMKAWIRSRVNLARRCVQQGKRYFSQIPILRYQLVCYLYCARYDGLLSRIERDEYQLKETYRERYKSGSLLRIAWLINTVAIKHFVYNGSSRR